MLQRHRIQFNSHHPEKMGIDGDTANMHQPKRQQDHRFTTTEWGEARIQPIKREKWDTGEGRGQNDH